MAGREVPPATMAVGLSSVCHEWTMTISGASSIRASKIAGRAGRPRSWLIPAAPSHPDPKLWAYSRSPRPSRIMMDIHESFGVPSEPRTLWGVIWDPRAVVGCVPGASLGDEQEDGSYDASVAVRFGPVKV